MILKYGFWAFLQKSPFRQSSISAISVKKAKYSFRVLPKLNWKTYFTEFLCKIFLTFEWMKYYF